MSEESLLDDSVLSPAQIFEGNREAAGQAAAKTAERILCTLGGADTKRFWEGTLPDYTHLTEDKIPIDRIRALTASMYRRPLESAYRVFQIDYADRLREEAQNALLKSLEEPPDYLIWLLIVDHRTKLLPTIRSRCQILHVGGETPECPLSSEEENFLFRLLEHAFAGEGIVVFDRKDFLHDWLPDKRRLPDAIVSILRDMLQYRVDTAGFETSPQRKEWIAHLAPKVSYAMLSRAIEQVEEMRGWLDVNINAQLAWEYVFLHFGQSREDGNRLV